MNSSLTPSLARYRYAPSHSRTGLVPSSQPWGLLGGTLMLLLLSLQPLAAATIVWGGATSDWNTAGNWSPAQVPGASDVATFNTTGVTTITLSSNSEVSSVQFNSQAPAYTITASPNTTLTISGTGITNSSLVTQNFVAATNVSGGTGAIRFNNSATAGSNTAFTTDGAQKASAGGADLSFTNNASGDHGTFTTNGATVSAGSGGSVQFYDNTTAGSANITTNGGAGGGDSGGSLIFRNNATGGTGTFMTNGSTTSSGDGGVTSFMDTSTAGSGAFTTNGGQAASAQGGVIHLNNTSTAGNGNFTNNASSVATGLPGGIQFLNSSDAGSGVFMNNGAGLSGNAGGYVEFFSSTTAKHGTFTNNGGTVAGAAGGLTSFQDSSSGGNGTFTTNGGQVASAQGGVIHFNNTSTAGNGNFTNNASTVAGGLPGGIQFLNSSDAGSGVFVNNGAALSGNAGGYVEFFSSTTANHGNFTNNGGTVAGASGGLISFQDSSTGGNGVFVNNGGQAASAQGGVIHFNNTSTAGSGNFTNNASTVAGGLAGGIQFLNSSDAGQGVFVNNGAGISGNAGGYVEFFSTTNANYGNFTNNGGTVAGAAGGITSFQDSSSGADGVFTNNGGQAASAQGGVVQFNNTSNAGYGSFTNNASTVAGGLAGGVQFLNSSNAANGLFENIGASVSGNAGGYVEFFSTTSASQSVLINIGSNVSGALGGVTYFLDSSTAGQAQISNYFGGHKGGGGGSTQFSDNSTAGDSTIFNFGGSGPSAQAGWTQFSDNSNAGRSVITNFGGSAAGAQGGYTLFSNASSAASATLIAYGGSNGGHGGSTVFTGNSLGVLAAVQVYGNGYLDISSHSAPGVSIGSLSGNGLVFLGANNLTVGANNAGTTFAGSIQNGGSGGGVGGSLTKIGTGALDLTGTNTYTGATNINGGSLFLDGSLASANITVNPGALLGGNGVMQGTLNNAGIVSPGHSPGSLVVGGNYYQGAGGELVIQIASPYSFDHLYINGHAGLNGTLAVQQLNGFVPSVGQRFVFLNANGGVTGQFSSVYDQFNTLGTMVKLDVVYGSNNVALVAAQNSLASAFGIDQHHPFGLLPLTANEVAVAGSIDSALHDPRMGKILAFLDHQPFYKVPEKLEEISPDSLTSMYTISFAQMDSQYFSVQQRMADIRNGVPNAPPPTPPMDRSKDGKDSKDTKEVQTAPTVSAPEQRFGFFITETGNFTTTGVTPNAKGYDIATAGTSLGFDYKFCDCFTSGISIDYSHTRIDLLTTGRLDADGGRAALYALYHHNGFFVDTLLGGGYNRYDAQRPALKGVATGSTDGGELDAATTMGYDAKWGGFTLTPQASALYTLVGLAGYNETGSMAPLHIDSQNESSLRSRLGLNASYSTAVGDAMLTPSLAAQWEHEYLNNELGLDATFADGTGSDFRVNGPEMGRDSILLSAAINLSWSRYAAYLAYQADLRRTNYNSQIVLVGLRMSW